MAIYRATMTGVLFLQTVQNVVHFSKPDPANFTEMQNLAIDLRDNWLTLLKPRLFTEVVYNTVKIDVVGTGISPHILTVFIQGTAGSGSTALPQACLVLKLGTAIAGRHGRGRVYLPSMGPACLVNGLVTSACLAVAQTTSDALLARYGPTGASTFKLVVFDRDGPTTGIQVISITPRATPGIQRRRGVGVGV